MLVVTGQRGSRGSVMVTAMLLQQLTGFQAKQSINLPHFAQVEIKVEVLQTLHIASYLTVY